MSNKCTLNAEQLAVVEAVKEGKSIFLTGSPGTGKSFTLNNIIKYLKESKVRYAVTSSTGCSAVIIGGQTIHSYLGLGIGNKPVDKIVLSMKNKRAVQELRVLVLDEISMLDDTTFTKISDVLKAVKGDKRPFGGIQVILVGDFCQLAPVQGNYCFTSETWQELNPTTIQLTQLIRQKDDKEFQEILQEVRFGKCSKTTVKRLQQLQNTKFPPGVIPTRLYPLNSDVNAINSMHFHNLYLKNNKMSTSDATKIQCWPYGYLDELSDFATSIHITRSTDSETDPNKDIFRYNATTNDKKVTIDDYHIELFKGLLVMVTRNINFDTGLINGTTGIITSLSTSSVSIKCLNDGAQHTIYYHKDINENNNTYVKFMPIKLAYALSIHKSQGATLDAIEVDASVNIFAPGQLYTALSRAKSLDSIRIINLDDQSFITHKSVNKFYAMNAEKTKK
jgi:ATP-dependent DNA helicase PIF1